MSVPIKVHLFRMRNPDGSSKDWAIPTDLDSGTLPVYFGRTGSTLRLTETPANRCRNRSVFQEVSVRIREKEHKGYQDLGVFVLAPNRRDLTLWNATTSASSQDAAADPKDNPPTAPVSSLYWRFRQLRTVETARRRTMAAACVEAIEHLASVGWHLPECTPDECEGLAIWLAVSKNTTQGILPLTEACKPHIGFFLLLAQQKLELTIANEQGQLITT